MKFPLKKFGLYAEVDEEDFDRLKAMGQWRIFKASGHVVLCGATTKGVIFMHHVVKGNPPAGYDCHHKNDIKHDNRKENLEFLSHAAHIAHRKVKSASGYRGVYYHHRSGKWVAKITVKDREYELGVRACPIEAAKLYDAKALEAYGKEAPLNFPV